MFATVLTKVGQLIPQHRVLPAFERSLKFSIYFKEYNYHEYLMYRFIFNNSDDLRLGTV